MSVKGKIKRLNREIKDLDDQLELSRKRHIRDKEQYEQNKQMLESLIKFFVVNQVGKPADGGVHIERKYVAELDSLGVDICYESENKAYVIKIIEEENKNEKNEKFV